MYVLSRIRGHEVTLVKDRCRLDIRKYSFSKRTLNEWNKLSTDCVICLRTRLEYISGGRITQRLKHVELSISQVLPCPLAILAFVVDCNLVQSFC